MSCFTGNIKQSTQSVCLFSLSIPLRKGLTSQLIQWESITVEMYLHQCTEWTQTWDRWVLCCSSLCGYMQCINLKHVFYNRMFHTKWIDLITKKSLRLMMTGEETSLLKSFHNASASQYNWPLLVGVTLMWCHTGYKSVTAGTESLVCRQQGQWGYKKLWI